MGSRDRLQQVVFGVGQSFESRHQDGHRLRLASGHHRGDRNVSHGYILSRRADFMPERHIRIEWAIRKHFIQPGLRGRDHGQTVSDVLPVEVVHDLFHIATGFVQPAFGNLDLIGHRQ